VPIARVVLVVVVALIILVVIKIMYPDPTVDMVK
jgi:hypothetical protein